MTHIVCGDYMTPIVCGDYMTPVVCGDYMTAHDAGGGGCDGQRTKVPILYLGGEMK
jgi:hypothetical protein